MQYTHYINSYADAEAIQSALDAGTLGKPYVAMNETAGTLDYNTQSPTPVVESRLKITYNFESTDETPVLAHMNSLFNGAPGKAEFPDGTEFIYNPEEEYEDSTIYYTPAETGVASIYYTFSGDTIGGVDDTEPLIGTDDGYVPAISIDIPDKVNTIRQGAFYPATYTGITIPNHALTIGYGAFQGEDGGDVSNLVSINNGENTIPSGYTLSGASFAFNNALEEITFGQGVTFGLEGDDGDFFGCQSLMNVTFLDTVPPSVKSFTFPWRNEGGGDYFRIHMPVGYEQAYIDSFLSDLSEDDPDIFFNKLGPGLIEAQTL